MTAKDTDECTCSECLDKIAETAPDTTAGGVEAGAPLTPEELRAVYAGPHYEAAINLVFGAQDGMTIGEVRDKLRTMLAASPAPAAGAEGWKLVPVEPSRAMVEAAYAAHDAYDDRPEPKAWCGLADAYRAMIAAAPSPKAGETENG